MDGMRFSDKVDRLREVHGIGSQKDLGALIGVPQPVISGWATKGPEQIRLNLIQMKALAATLKVPADYLIDDDQAEPPAPAITPEESVILDVLRALRLPKDEAIRRLSGNNGSHGIVAVTHPTGPDRLPPPGPGATRGIDRVTATPSPHPTEPGAPSKRRAR